MRRQDCSPLGSLPLPDPQSENEHGGEETKNHESIESAQNESLGVVSILSASFQGGLLFQRGVYASAVLSPYLSQSLRLYGVPRSDPHLDRSAFLRATTRLTRDRARKAPETQFNHAVLHTTRRRRGLSVACPTPTPRPPCNPAVGITARVYTELSTPAVSSRLRISHPAGAIQ